MTMILKGIKSSIELNVVAEVLTDNGRTLKVPFLVTYRKPSVSEARDMMSREPLPQDNPREYTQLRTRFQQEVLRDNVLNWREVPTETGEPFEFSAENLNEMLDATEYLAALWSGFLTVVTGKGALTKN